jgi:beta-1,2-mannobiose phosphorylase / 1,2-beta-oligomannan phosphorylase
MKIEKWSGNPVLTPKGGSNWDSLQVRNPAVIFHEDTFYMLYTATAEKEVENLIYLGLATSKDGFHFERFSDKPLLSPGDEFDGFDAGAVEDARVVKIGDTFYITYAGRALGWAAFHKHGKRLSPPPSDGPTWTKNFRRGALAVSKDMKNFEKRGPITSEHLFDANITLFPEKINGKFAMLHRPSNDIPSFYEGGERPGIHITFSEDMVNWENDKVLAKPEFSWEYAKIGAGPPPIKTEAGWLLIYHAVDARVIEGPYKRPWVYRAGVMLLELDNPCKVIARSPHYIMEPETVFEMQGTVPNVVFPTGVVQRDDTLFIYYGGADTVCCVATVKTEEILEYILRYRI